MMTAKDQFGVIVRVIGLLMTLIGVGGTIADCVWRLGPSGAYMDTSDFMIDLALVTVGVFLLRGAPLISAFSYPTAYSSRERVKSKAPLPLPERRAT